MPYAQCYGGHQFGMWAGQLGDGRAMTLGEILNSNSERWELQLKGAGKTPYSRFADGLAVLRSSVREFLCSEAMHHLGIPTTRALSLVTTGNLVTRDMFYEYAIASSTFTFFYHLYLLHIGGLRILGFIYRLHFLFLISHAQRQSKGRTWRNCLQSCPIFSAVWVIPNTCLQK